MAATDMKFTLPKPAFGVKQGILSSTGPGTVFDRWWRGQTSEIGPS